MRIFLDVAGGDNAPAATVHGAVLAARAYGCTMVLAGPAERIRTELAKHITHGLSLEVIDAPETIDMHEAPAQAIRRKPRSPHAIGLRMVRNGDVDAFVSAGHSGATMAGATLLLGRAAGVERPALGGFFPTLNRPILIVDIGATIDCRPEHLFQFAHMGSVYSERALGISAPRVALLCNGEEDTKGNRLVQEAHALLRRSRLHFVGNAEPKDALVGNVCDVLVCDGFAGNLFIKTSEAVVGLASRYAWREVRQNWLPRLFAGLAPIALLVALGKARWSALLGGLIGGPSLFGSLLIPPLLRVRKVADYRYHGGAPLLGLRGVAIVAHGRSDARAIMHAIRQARDAVERRTVLGITDALAPLMAVASSA